MTRRISGFLGPIPRSNRGSVPRCTWAMSSSSTLPTLPPAARWVLQDDPRGNLNSPETAELPELLRRAGVLKDEFIDLERVDLSGLEPFESRLHVKDELAKLLFVIGR